MAINSISYGSNTYTFTLPYGTCSTSASTKAKTVSVGSFSLTTGARILIKFTVTNTASSPTLNVNSTGAKSIMYRGSAISAGYLAANRVYEFVYDGTDWELIGDIDTNTTYSLSSFGVTATAAEINALPDHTHTVSHTPAGTVSKPTFTGSAVTSGKPDTTNVTTIYSITGVGSVPTLTASVANKCLTLTFTAGSVPTRSSAISMPNTNHTHSVTAKGSVSQPTFTGTAATLTSSTPK